MNTEIAIKVTELSKSFDLPLSRKDTLQGHFVNPFEKAEYRKFEPLKNISFEVRKGEFFSIIGRNGIGKSTLLKILSGIYEPGEGKVEVKGKLVPFLELGVGFNHELTARENVYLNAVLLGLSRKEVSASFDEIFDFAELDEFREVPVKNFSSGMQVRLAFSIAVKVKSDILILDEVLAVGDASFQKKCYKYFDSIIGKKTIVFVSHDLKSVKKNSDRVMYLKENNEYEIGDPDKIVSLYKDEVT